MKENKCRIVSDMIRRDIENGIYQAGDKIPSEHQLASRTGCSRTTVRRAVVALEREGLVQRRQGSGTYINAGKERSDSIQKVGVLVSSTQGTCGQAFLQGVESVLARRGLEMICEQSNRSRTVEAKILRHFLDQGVDGILVEAVSAMLPGTNLALYDALQTRGIPVVFINCCYQEIRKSVCVAMDDRACGYRLGQALLHAGQREIIALLRWDEPQGLRCFAGIHEAFEEAGVPLPEERVVWYAGKDDAQWQWKQRNDLPANCTACVCYDRKIAMMVRHQGDHRLCCISLAQNEDDEMPSDGVHLVTRPSFKQGEMAAQKLLNILHGRMESSTLLAWEIPPLQ